MDEIPISAAESDEASPEADIEHEARISDSAEEAEAEEQEVLANADDAEVPLAEGSETEEQEGPTGNDEEEEPLADTATEDSKIAEISQRRSRSRGVDLADDLARLSSTDTNLERLLMEQFTSAAALAIEEEEEEEDEGSETVEADESKVVARSLTQTRSIWDDLDSMRRTHSDASHNLFSPQNSRTLLFLRQKSYVTVFESLALYSILEALELELEVLGHVFPGLFMESDEVDFLSYDERFSRETNERELYHLPSLKNFKDPFVVDESQQRTPEERLAKKLQKDRAFLQEIVVNAKEEIGAERSFETLKNHVRREDNRRNEEVTLLERMDKAFLAVKKLKHRMTEYEAQMNRHEQNRKEMILELKDQLHDEKMKGEGDARYSRAWHQAHNRFHYETLKHEAEIAKLRLKDVEIQMTRDRLAHKNLEMWTARRSEEILNTIKEWREKFDADVEEIEKRIEAKQAELNAQMEIIQGLEENIEIRRIEMAPWEVEKERQRLERIEYLRLYYSARKIQRWWRAYMLKHNLYKNRPKKAKKGKKGVGKKGKSKKAKAKKSKKRK